MTKTNTLKATKREGTGKGVARKLRQAGSLPAVLYGKDMDSIHLTLDAQEVRYLFDNISVDNTIVSIDVEGEKEAFETLVRDIQTHPYKTELVHIDFLRIQAGVAVDVDVPLHLVGTPVGVKQDGGSLEQVIHDLPVRCIPSKIPESIEVDVSGLELEGVLHVYDLTFDEGVEVTIDPSRTICLVSVPRAAEEEVEEEEGVELPEGVEADADEAAETEASADADSEDDA